MRTRMGTIESHFADLVWANAPMTTRQLIDLCEKELNWKRTTTYTVLKKMCDRGIFAMNNRQVTVLVPKPEFSALQSEQFVQAHFHGSLPAFIAAFTSRRELTAQELKEIQQLIDSMGE